MAVTTTVANSPYMPTSGGAFTGAVSFAQPSALPDGAVSAANLSLYFANDTDTGIYRVSTNRLGIGTNGKLQADFDDGNIGFGDTRNIQFLLFKSGTGAAASMKLAGSSSSGGEFIAYGSGHATKAGIVGLTTTAATNATDALTLLNGPAGKAGNPVGYINIEINGTTRVIPYW